VRAHTNLGLALGEKGDLDGEIAEYREAIELDPKDASAHTNLGIALREKGELCEAVAAYRRAVELDPTGAMARYYLACTDALRGNVQEGIAGLAAAIDLEPNWAAEAREEPDFDNIRADPEFQRLVGNDPAELSQDHSS